MSGIQQSVSRRVYSRSSSKSLQIAPPILLIGISLSGVLILGLATLASRQTIFLTMLTDLCLLLLVPLIVGVAMHNLDPFEPVFIFNFGYFLFFAATPMYLIHLNGLQFVGTYPIHVRAIEVAIVGLLSFYAGYYGWAGRKPRSGLRLTSDWKVTPGIVFVFILLALGVLATYVFCEISRVSVLDLIAEIGRSEKYYITSQNAYLYLLIFLVDAAGIIGACILFRGKTRSVSARASLVGALAPSAVFNLLLSGSRIHTFTVLIAWMTQYHYLRRRIKTTWLGLAAIGLLACSTLFLAVRTYLPEGGIGKVTENVANYSTIDTYVEGVFRGGDLNFYPNLLEVMEDVPDRFNYLYGLSYLKLLFAPIPRFIWPGKPETTGRVFTKHWQPLVYRAGGSAGAGILGEAYMNFGWLGIPIVLFGFGVLCRSLYTFLEVNQFNASSVLLYSATTFMLLFDTLRGEFEGSAIKAIMLGMTALLALHLMNVRRVRRGQVLADQRR